MTIIFEVRRSLGSLFYMILRMQNSSRLQTSSPVYVMNKIFSQKTFRFGNENRFVCVQWSDHLAKS